MYNIIQPCTVYIIILAKVCSKLLLPGAVMVHLVDAMFTSAGENFIRDMTHEWHHNAACVCTSSTRTLSFEMQLLDKEAGIEAPPLPAVVCSVWFDASAFLAVSDLLSLLSSFQHLLLWWALSGNNTLHEKKKNQVKIQIQRGLVTIFVEC